MKRLFFVILLLFPAVVSGQHGHAPAKAPAPPVTLATGLGDINHPVTTNNPEAQKFFNQGLAYIYAFNHEEAVRSFKQAAQLDPQSRHGLLGRRAFHGIELQRSGRRPGACRGVYQFAKSNRARAKSVRARSCLHQRSVETLLVRH